MSIYVCIYVSVNICIYIYICVYVYIIYVYIYIYTYIRKGLKGWVTEETPICREFSYTLRMYVSSLSQLL